MSGWVGGWPHAGWTRGGESESCCGSTAGVKQTTQPGRVTELHWLARFQAQPPQREAVAQHRSTCCLSSTRGRCGALAWQHRRNRVSVVTTGEPRPTRP